ncbi:MAG: DUF5666 domain-containing protein [Candidatus Omnitrophica bacterium]|nr:DUF5666 domain-containing protein [Candidatus Omnitrophota bacterium]
MKSAKIILAIVSILFVFVTASYADGIKGNITAIDNEDYIIHIAGVKITVQNAVIENESNDQIYFSGLAIGNYVDVEGSFTDTAKMAADTITLEHEGSAMVKGQIESIDFNTREISISGIKIQVSDQTQLQDRNYTDVTLEQFNPNDYVECNGSWIEPLKLAADKVKMD